MKCWPGISLQHIEGEQEHTQPDNKEYSLECPRECIEGFSPVKRKHTPWWERSFTYKTVLQRAEQLYQINVCEDRWLVCQPTGAGHLLVIDGEGKALLDRLARPQTLADLIAVYGHISFERLQKLLQIFLQAGIVSTNDTPASRQPELIPQIQTLQAWLHITNSCNLGCAYCYLAKTPEHMSEETAFRAVDALFRSARRHHFERVTLRYAGGEASLRLHHVLTVHDYAQEVARRHDIHLTGVLLSNGVFFTDDMIKQLKERRISVMISLDGVGRYHDMQRPFVSGRSSFQQVNRTIRRLLLHGLVPSISITVSQSNAAGLPELMAYLLEHNLPFGMNYYRDNEHAVHPDALQFAEQEIITAIRKAMLVIEAHLPRRPLLASFIDKANIAEAHQYTCSVGRNYLVVDQHGGIAKCHAQMEQTVATIEADDPLWSVRNDQRGVQGLSVDEKEGCKSCPWRYWCAGGCPVLTYRLTGRYDIKSPNCHVYQTLFPEVLRLEALRLLKYGNVFDC
ncbi:MAG TPA: radical SAM protein [Ktedonobacteraceae bacterium]|nr:radical SAM protein [Ktedonobacteraceae bacterium]